MKGLCVTKTTRESNLTNITATINPTGYDWLQGTVTISAADSCKSVVFRQGENEVMRLKNSKLDIGMTDPTTKLSIAGSNNSYEYGPHTEVYLADSYPVFQHLNMAHDNVAMSFDCYYDGSNWRSNTSNNSYQIPKTNGVLAFSYASNVPTSSNITFSNLMVMNNGQEGIGKSPSYPLDVNGIVNSTGLYVNGAPYIGSQWQSPYEPLVGS
jgi:hypothetical protein